MTLFRNGKRAREPLSQTDRSNRLEEAEDSSSNSSSNSARKRRKGSASPPHWRSPFTSITKFISHLVSPRPPLAPRARLASPKRQQKARNMVEITRNALQPLPPSTLSLNARQTSSSFPTTIPPPIPQHAAPVFRPHASTSTSILSSAAKYKWDVMEAKAAGRPLPAKPRESSNVRGGGGYRKKQPIGSHKRKETLEDKHMARISTLGQMQLSFEQGRKEGYDGTFEQFQDYEQFRLTVANTLPADAFETASNLPSKKNRPATVETTRKSDVDSIFASQKKTLLTTPRLAKSLEEFHRMREEIERAAEEDLVPVRRIRRFPARLSAEDQAIVSASLADSAFDVSMPGAQVQAKDIRKLKGLSWINDEIITYYAIMINLRSNLEEARILALPDPKPKAKEGDLLKVWSFNSFFYAKFTSSQFAGVKRWTKKVDIFAKDVVIVPVNQGNSHWVCAAINITKKRFEFYDSMGHQRKDVYKKLRAYLAAEHLDKKKKPLDLSDWEDYWDPDVPQQSNGSDCGIFTCQFMECLSRRVDGFDFTQENMPYLRNKMVLEITQSKIIPETSYN